MGLGGRATQACVGWVGRTMVEGRGQGQGLIQTGQAVGTEEDSVGRLVEARAPRVWLGVGLGRREPGAWRVLFTSGLWVRVRERARGTSTIRF